MAPFLDALEVFRVNTVDHLILLILLRCEFGGSGRIAVKAIQATSANPAS